METVSGNQGGNSYLDFYRQFQGYLKTHMQIDGTELSRPPETKVKITVINTAPSTPEWPKIVFMGIGVTLACPGHDTIVIRPRLPVGRETRPGGTPSIQAVPWQQDHTFKNLSAVRYRCIAGQDFPEVTSDESSHGEVLFPGQSAIFEINVPAQLTPFVQFRVNGTLSRRHLHHYEQTLQMPEPLTRPPVVAALRAFNDIDIHRALNSAITSMPSFSNDTRLAELQAFSTTLTSGMDEIKATQEALIDVSRGHEVPGLRAQVRAAIVCLNRVGTALARMKEAIASSAPDRIAEAAAALRALKKEAAQLNRATEELMQERGISDEEVSYKYRGL